MKQYNIYLSMVALALVGAMMSSCSEEIEVVQPANTGKTVMVKTTVSLGENATTRALTIAGVKTFAAGDQIAVIYKNTDDQTVKAVSLALTDDDIDNTDAHNATFSVPLTNPKPGGDVRYIYPASMVADNVSATTPDNDATIKWTNLTTQDGTLASLASNLDLATFDGTMTAEGKLPNSADLANPLTIGKFTIKNSGATDITSSITGLNISDGTNTYAVSRMAADGPIYVAMQPITSTQTVAVNVTDGTNHYTKTVTEDYALVASNIYDIAVTISSTPGANLSAVTADYIAQDGEELTGTLGSNVKLSIADGATVTLNNVTINGNGDNEDDDNYQWAGITCKGDATINIEGTNIVKRFYKDYPAIQAGPAGKTLIIGGTGSLTATGGNYGAGIGSSYDSTCGDITINGGTIIASSRWSGAGIGTGLSGTCGNITINGGDITASSGSLGSAIGSGNSGKFGNITIYAGITQVRAKCHSDAWPIGKGYQDRESGTVTIDNCSVTSKDWDGTGMTQLHFAATNDGNLYTWTLNQYPLSIATATLSSVDIGKVLAADGKIYADAASANTNGGGACAVIAYVGSVPNYFDKFLAIALTDVDNNTHTWADAHTAVGTFAYSHGITIGSMTYNTNAVVNNTYYDVVDDDWNREVDPQPVFTQSATRTNAVLKGWRLPSVTDWRYIIQGFGGPSATNPIGVIYDGMYASMTFLNVINTACGNTEIQRGSYWTSSLNANNENEEWVYEFDRTNGTYHYDFFVGQTYSYSYHVRAVFAY